MAIFLWEFSRGMVKGSKWTSRSKDCMDYQGLLSNLLLIYLEKPGSKRAQMLNLLHASNRIIDSESVSIFKKSLDSFLSQVPDKPTVAGYGRAAGTNSPLHQLPLHCFC